MMIFLHSSFNNLGSQINLQHIYLRMGLYTSWQAPGRLDEDFEMEPSHLLLYIGKNCVLNITQYCLQYSCYQVPTYRPILLILGPSRPYQGLWVGDYSTHGCEFLLFLQRTPTRLEVLKITGDHNVPRGEFTFVVPNLNEPSRICDEPEFLGVRAVQGWAQIANALFQVPQWTGAEGKNPMRLF